MEKEAQQQKELAHCEAARSYNTELSIEDELRRPTKEGVKLLTVPREAFNSYPVAFILCIIILLPITLWLQMFFVLRRKSVWRTLQEDGV